MRLVNPQLLSLLMVISLFTPWQPAVAQSAIEEIVSQPESRVTTLPNTTDLILESTDNGVTVRWSIAGQRESGAFMHAVKSTFATMATVHYGGYALPMQLQTLLLADDAQVSLHIEKANSVVWAASLMPAPQPAPPTSGWEDEYEAPKLAEPALPSSPLFILREGRIRGQRVVVLAFSPIFAKDGHTKAVYNIRAHVTNAEPLSGELTQLQTRQLRRDDTLINPEEIPEFPIGPFNLAAYQQAIKIVVAQAGIQRIPGSVLMENGFPAGIELANLELWYQGRPTAIEIHDDDSLLDSLSEVRFYVAPPSHSMQMGDRWNRADTYWLTQETKPGLRMSSRAVTPASAPERNRGMERGIWEEYEEYESTMPGVDGDHWFSEKMRVQPSTDANPTVPVSHQAPLRTILPLASTNAELSHFRITGSARSLANHHLQINLGDRVEVLSWTNQDYYEAWEHTVTSTVRHKQLELALLPSAVSSDVRLDKIYWQQPVLLDFNARGAVFSGVAGLWRYRLTNTPADSTLYDITDPVRPQILITSVGSSFSFEDGPLAHDYVLSGPGTLHTPAVYAHTPVSIITTMGADALYIAPAEFHEQLAPLVEHRQRQGYQVYVADVQDIYDLWSHGQISADAIRDFLRFAVHHWEPSPISAVLVGDSTVDPHNYGGWQNGAANVNVMPAYFAEVDEWIGETVCENCFAQLDGMHPLDGMLDPDFLPDIWLGRFSVQDEAQLTTVVGKILRYEMATDFGIDDRWRQTSLYIADNFLDEDGNEDPAGNFPYLSDIIFAGDPDWGILPSQSPNMLVERIYYDPRPSTNEPWRESDATKARDRTIDALRRGPGLVSFNGHSNHFQWASTDRTIENPYLLGTNDILTLDNIDRLSIVLGMTCFTSQFTHTSRTGTTMDERFQRFENGGSVAVWGSGGLTVAHGHDSLMRGFQQKLWSVPPLTARLGELTEAGYLELFRYGVCCQTARKVYLLLGDPLTPALVWAPSRIYLPTIVR